MSVINQMLRDLDRREASATERAGWSGQVKALPPPRCVSWPRLLAVLGGTAGVLALAATLWPMFESQPWHGAGTVASAPNIAVATPPPAVTPPPAPPAMPALTVPMPVVKSAPKAVPIPAPSPPTIVADPAPPPAVLAEPVVAIDKRPLGQAGGERAEAEYRQGMSAYRQGQTAEAVTGFQKALAADRRHVAARQALLSLLMAERRWTEAQAVASEGLALDAAQSGWAMTLARLQFEQGQLAEAERTMATHRRHGEHSPDYLVFHGLLLEKLDRRDEARVAYQKALDSGKLAPALAEAVEQRLR